MAKQHDKQFKLDAVQYYQDSMLLDNRSIDVVYKTEEKPRLDYFIMEKY